MNKTFISVFMLINLLAYQSIAIASCETMTAAEVSQFTQTHSDEWKGIIMVSSLFSSAPSENVTFVQGTPLQVYTITTDSIQNYASEGSIESTLVQTGVWYIPVSITSTYNLLEIHCFNDELKIVGTAGSRIAEQLNKLNALSNLAEKIA